MGKLLAFLAKLFGYLLNFIYVHVNNYGLAIILFTVAVQIILLPFFIKQQKTLIKNSRIQGKLAELREKYKNDQVRLGQETMDLYKREKMSPFSGCLGSILQIIIFISIFYLVRQPLTYMEKRSPEEINSYREKYEISENSAYKEIDIIREANNRGDNEININMMFLGVDLSNIPSRNWTNWTVYIIPGLYVVSSIISMKITQAQSGLNKKDKKKNNSSDVIDVTEESKELNEEIKNAKIDENIKEIPENNEEKSLVRIKKKKKKEEEEDEEDMTAAMSKQMSIMMPVMAVSIALVAPLGLALYWLVNNIIQTLQRVILSKIYKEKED